jgi:VanZ family protein
LARNYFLYISIVFTLAITVGSLISAKNLEPIPVQISDKIIHFSAYFVLALCWFLTFNKIFKSLTSFIIIGLCIFFYGIVIEVCQMLITYNRTADVYDILANLAGILLGLASFILFLQKNK